MLNDQVFYHGIIRKAIVSFGRLFSSIYIDRKEGDSVSGDTIQRLHIPLSYAPKEKWIVRIDSDPTLENHTYTTLPRISFEITGYGYDAQRKVAKMNRVVCHGDTSSTNSFAPAPYNVEISLYVLTKTQEDALQIIEQILPTFNPEYTLSVNTVEELGIVQDIPVVLNSVSVQDDYDGDYNQRRFVTHTLSFQLKLNLFGYVNNNKVIYESTANVATTPDMTPNEKVVATGNPTTGGITDEWTFDL